MKLRMTVRDLMSDVGADLASRLGRTILLLGSVALSTGALATSTGVGGAASEQIRADLAAATTNEITVSASAEPRTPGDALFPPNAESRAEDVALVNDAGLRLDIEASVAQVERLPGATATSDVRTIAVSSGYLRTIDAGGVPASWAFTAEPVQLVALVGSDAAERLGLPPEIGADGSYEIVVAGLEVQVVGTVHGSSRDLDDAVLIPYPLGIEIAGSDQDSRLVVSTQPGAGARVAEVVRAAVRPDSPEALSATRVSDLAGIRRGVESQLARSSGTVGLLLLAISGLLIASSMVTAVASRVPEIGLRRALGFSRGNVLALFLAEGGLIGLIGGMTGGAVGAWAVVVVSYFNEWTAVMNGTSFARTAAIGLAVGLASSAYPAIRAARISPATAVRAE